MKKFLLGVLGTVIAGIFVALFTLYINKEKIDVKYNLSAPISIPSEKDYVQQLRIQNVGNATAENLVITLNGNIQKYEIKKYSEQDNIQEFELTDSNGKQICYSKLPKDGSIIITMNINGSDSLKIDIKHDKGKATEVFSSQTKVGFALIFFAVSMLFYLLFGVKNLIDDYWITSILQYHRKKIFSRDKPFLLSESRWKEIRGMAIENEIASIKRDYFISAKGLQESSALNYLNNDKINKLKLDNEEQKKIISAVKDYFLNEFRNLRNMLYSKNDYVEILSISKPDLVEESVWLIEREKTFLLYEEFIKSKCYEIYDVSKIVQVIEDALDINIISDIEKNKITQDIKQWWLKNLKQWINGLSSDSDKKYIEQFFQTEKPNYFIQSEWDSIKNIANDKYLEIILYELSYSSKNDYEKILRKENQKINLLSDDCCKKIKKYAEQLYCLSIMEDSLILFHKELVDKYDFTLLESNRITAILKLIDKAQSIEKLLNSSVEGIDKLEIPESVEKSFWNSIIEYRTKNAELNDKLQEVNKEELKLKVKIEKVLRQLTFINTILDSPDEIDRIEDYEDLFSKGNYENLRKIKGLLESNNTRGKE